MKIAISGTYSSGKTLTSYALAHYVDIPRTRARTMRELLPFAVPGKTLEQVEVTSVRKKMKRADFARNVSRDDIVNGAAELGVDLDEHIGFTLEAMRGIGAELGL